MGAHEGSLFPRTQIWLIVLFESPELRSGQQLGFGLVIGGDWVLDLGNQGLIGA